MKGQKCISAQTVPAAGQSEFERLVRELGAAAEAEARRGDWRGLARRPAVREWCGRWYRSRFVPPELLEVMGMGMGMDW